MADGAAAEFLHARLCPGKEIYKAGQQGRTQVTIFMEGMGGELLVQPSRSSLRLLKASARCSRPDAARLLMLMYGRQNKLQPAPRAACPAPTPVR